MAALSLNVTYERKHNGDRHSRKRTEESLPVVKRLADDERKPVVRHRRAQQLHCWSCYCVPRCHMRNTPPLSELLKTKLTRQSRTCEHLTMRPYHSMLGPAARHAGLRIDTSTCTHTRAPPRPTRTAALQVLSPMIAATRLYAAPASNVLLPVPKGEPSTGSSG